jgi:alpha-beta hydrolase superfamily lysophospholipase
VLVLIPSFNDGVGALCSDASPWARFADAHNLLLVVPQFFQVHTIWKVDHPCSPYHFPQLWAGQVVLDAIEKIAAKQPIDSRRIYLHGFGAGAQFAARFARWNPERVAALSLHSGCEYPWKEFEHGLQPLSAFKDLPVLLTIGETDDEGVNFVSRRDGTETFLTVLKGMGANVEYHVIDTTFHRESPRLRDLAESFLSNQLQNKNTP